MKLVVNGRNSIGASTDAFQTVFTASVMHLLRYIYIYIYRFLSRPLSVCLCLSVTLALSLLIALCVYHGSWQAFRLPKLELAFTERREHTNEVSREGAGGPLGTLVWGRSCLLLFAIVFAHLRDRRVAFFIKSSKMLETVDKFSILSTPLLL